jgi:hypothetical protein
MTYADDDGLHTVDFNTSFVYQGGALGDEVSTMKIHELVPASGNYPCDALLFGESINSAREAVQKFTQNPYYSRLLGETGDDRIYTMHLPAFACANQYLSMNPSFSMRAYFNWAAHYIIMYVGIASSVRYKIMNTSPTAFPMSAAAVATMEGLTIEPATYSTPPSTVAPVWVAAQGEGVEVTVPYYFNRLYLISRAIFSAATVMGGGAAPNRINKLDFLPIFTGSPTKPSAVVYTALGPDVRFHQFRQIPAIILSDNGGLGPLYGNQPYVPA